MASRLVAFRNRWSVQVCSCRAWCELRRCVSLRLTGGKDESASLLPTRGVWLRAGSACSVCMRLTSAAAVGQDEAGRNRKAIDCSGCASAAPNSSQRIAFSCRPSSPCIWPCTIIRRLWQEGVWSLDHWRHCRHQTAIHECRSICSSGCHHTLQNLGSGHFG